MGCGEDVIVEIQDKSTDYECSDDGMRTEGFLKLLDLGIDPKVAAKLDEVFKTGILKFSELDDRVLDAFMQIYDDEASKVLNKFLKSKLEHVCNKSAFICGLIKSLRQKTIALRNGVSAYSLENSPQYMGPSDNAICEFMKQRAEYQLDITMGQRKYYLPNSDQLTVDSSEIFCGRIPRDVFEDELILLFEKCGTILDLRLMMDSWTKVNRGYAFVTFHGADCAQKAVENFHNYEIRPNKCLKVNASVPNRRIFVGNIPKIKTREEIFNEFMKITPGLEDVIIYESVNEQKYNRGFCFLEYDTHKNASLARRRLEGKARVWKCNIIVDWADPVEQPDERIMNRVKVLYVRNIVEDITENILWDEFEMFGIVERVKKIKDYAFVHFQHRDNAILAMRTMNGVELGGARIEVTLAKPPTDKKKREHILQARERRMLRSSQHRMPIQLETPTDVDPNKSTLKLKQAGNGQPIELPVSVYTVCSTFSRLTYDSVVITNNTISAQHYRFQN